MNNNSRKKILLVTRPIAPPWDEASKNFAYYLAKNISSQEFYLLTNGFIQGLPKNIHQKPIYTSNKLTWLQQARLLKLMKLRKDMDIIHFMLTPTKLNALGFKAFVENKNAKTIQTIATLREDLFSDSDYKNILFADLIITYSDYAKNKLNGLGFNNVKRVYPGVDIEHYCSREKNVKYLQKINFRNSDFIINFTGEYSRLGAIDGVIESFIEISKIIPSAKLSLAVRLKNKEDVDKKREVIEILNKNNLLQNVSFHDSEEKNVENYTMADVYNICDISLFPVSDMKGKFDVPLAVIEAMACEKPVIISDLPILREFATPDNSVIIPKENRAALYKAILALYENPIRRQEIGKIARKFVEENFDIKKVAEIYAEIYEKL